MATLVFKGFSGEVPRLSPKDLANNQASYAKNCKVYSGKIMPFRDYVDILNLGPLASPPLFIYLFNSYWIYWTTDVNVVKSPVTDVDDRTYVTGMDVPRVFDSGMIPGHTAASTDLTSYRTGVPRPDKALIVEREMVYKIDEETVRGGIGMSAIGVRAIALGGAPENIEAPTDEQQSIAYVYTNVNSWGEEGAESPPSRIIDHWSGIDKKVSLNETTGLWIASVTGTDEWIYTGSMGDINHIPSSVSVKGVTYLRDGTAGELKIGEWAWNGNTVIIRLSASDPDPNNLDDDDIEAGWQRYVDVSGFVNTYENDAGDSVALSSEHHIVKRRIYRVNLGSSVAAYQFVDEIDVVAGVDATYRDVLLSANLGEVLATSTYLPPPEDLIGLIALPGGGMAGFRQGDNAKELCLCVPYKPYAWPSGYRVTVNSSIVAIGSTGNTIVIGTDGETLLYTGLDPGSMAFDDNSIQKPCLSKRGMVTTESGVFFPTVDGTLVVGPGGARVITNDIMREREWRMMQPETMTSFFLNQNYVAYHDYDFDLNFVADQDLRRQENIEAYFADGVISGFIGASGIGCGAGRVGGGFTGGTGRAGHGAIGASKIQPIYVSMSQEGGEGLVVGSGISEGTLVRLDYSYAGYMNGEDGFLYVVQKIADDYVIRKLDGHDTRNMLSIWTSKLHELPGLVNFGAAKVIADFGDPVPAARRAAYDAYRAAVIAANEALMDSDEGVGGSVDAFDMNDVAVNDDKLQEVPAELADDPTLLFRLFAADQGELKLKYQKMVSANTPFRLPGRYRGRKVQISIISDIEVEEVRLSTSMEELVQVGG